MASTLSAIITVSLTNPLDICKVRLTSRVSNYGTTNVFRLLPKIVKNEGFKALSKGLGPRMGVYLVEASIWANGYEFLMWASTTHEN